MKTLTKEEYKTAIDNVILLCRCAADQTAVTPQQAEKIDLDHLYQAAEKHMLTAAVAYALRAAGISDKKFEQARAKAVRKVTAMDIDKTLLFEKMEQEKIWYMPLKGAVIKDWYPSIGMRQMSDFDILFDKDRAEDIRRIFLELGFTCQHFGNGNQDTYFKLPVSNFEMHRELFNASHKPEIYQYYRNVKSRLIKDENNSFGYHFGNEDMYIYLTAHEYKHFSDKGTGLRSLSDTYIFWKKFGDCLDNAYILSETEKLGISDFERQKRSLALHLFGGETLTEKESDMLEYMICSGTYGTLHNGIKNGVNQYGGGHAGKKMYIRKKIFLPMDTVKAKYPFYYRHKILLPFLPVYRIGKALTVDREHTKKILKTLKNIK